MAYYGLGTKEAILSDLETQLKTISGIKTVDYQRTDPRGASPERYPGVFINDLRTDREQKLGDIWKNTFTAVLVGFVWAQPDEDLVTKMNSFIVTTKGKVLADPYRNNNARDTNVDTIVTDGGAYHPQGQFMMTLTIIFYSAN